MRKLFVMIGLLSMSVSAFAGSYYSNVACKGTVYRLPGAFTSLDGSLLYINVKATDTGAEVKSVVGHVSLAQKNGDASAPATIGELAYYSQFASEKVELKLAPRATKYKDADYLRFDLADVNDNGHDGGGMNGYFVLSKRALDVFKHDGKPVPTFDAHYVLQSGDHTGGTLDFDCQQL